MITAILILVILNTLFNTLFMATVLWGIISDSKSQKSANQNNQKGEKK